MSSSVPPKKCIQRRESHMERRSRTTHIILLFALCTACSLFVRTSILPVALNFLPVRCSDRFTITYLSSHVQKSVIWYNIHSSLIRVSFMFFSSLQASNPWNFTFGFQHKIYEENVIYSSRKNWIQKDGCDVTIYIECSMESHR